MLGHRFESLFHYLVGKDLDEIKRKRGPESPVRKPWTQSTSFWVLPIKTKLDRCNIARILLKQQKYSNLPVAVTKMHVRM